VQGTYLEIVQPSNHPTIQLSMHSPFSEALHTTVECCTGSKRAQAAQSAPVLGRAVYSSRSLPPVPTVGRITPGDSWQPPPQPLGEPVIDLTGRTASPLHHPTPRTVGGRLLYAARLFCSV
jgi:hypothetical protein